MPFDFMSKGKGSSKNKTVEAPRQPKSKGKDLAGKSFDEQVKALQPDKDDSGKGGKGLRALFGGGKGHKGKDAVPKDGAQKGAPAARLTAAEEKITYVLINAQADMCGQARNISGRLDEQIEHFDKTMGPLSKHAPIRSAREAQAAAKNVIESGWRLENSNKVAEATGNIDVIKVHAAEFMAAAAEFHRSLFGHGGPDDFITVDGILGEQSMPGLVGGRTLSTDEKDSKLDPREQPQQRDLDFREQRMLAEQGIDPRQAQGFNKEQLTKKGTGNAIRTYGFLWSEYYKRAVGAVAQLG